MDAQKNRIKRFKKKHVCEHVQTCKIFILQMCMAQTLDNEDNGGGDGSLSHTLKTAVFRDGKKTQEEEDRYL